MIGIVIVSHSNISKEFLIALEHIVGKQDNMIAISILPSDDVEAKRNEIIEAVKMVNKNKGVIILTDMFGGTPSNLAISVMEEKKVEVVAGVNLPMLIQLAQVRSSLSLEGAVTEAQDAGRKYINVASQLLAARNK